MVAPSNVGNLPFLDLYLMRDEVVAVSHVNRQSQTGILGSRWFALEVVTSNSSLASIQNLR